MIFEILRVSASKEAKVDWVTVKKHLEGERINFYINSRGNFDTFYFSPSKIINALNTLDAPYVLSFSDETSDFGKWNEYIEPRRWIAVYVRFPNKFYGQLRLLFDDDTMKMVMTRRRTGC